jgi:hypothetical protein
LMTAAANRHDTLNPGPVRRFVVRPYPTFEFCIYLVEKLPFTEIRVYTRTCCLRAAIGTGETRRGPQRNCPGRFSTFRELECDLATAPQPAAWPCQLRDEAFFPASDGGWVLVGLAPDRNGENPKVAGTLRVPSAHCARRHGNARTTAPRQLRSIRAVLRVTGERHTECACYFAELQRVRDDNT